MAVAPALGAVRAALGAALGRDVHMTGSGSALFALARTGEDAQGLAARAGTVPGITPIPARLA